MTALISPRLADDDSRRSDRDLARDLKTLARFVHIWCKDCHGDVDRTPVDVQLSDTQPLTKHPIALCDECRKLLTHAVVKRTACPMDPKPACKHCPNHCYHPKYRAMIRQAMKHSGRKLVMTGRIDYLLHLLF